MQPVRQAGAGHKGRDQGARRGQVWHHLRHDVKDWGNGPGRHELYDWMINSEAGGGRDIDWNFTNFVINRCGQVFKRHEPHSEFLGWNFETFTEVTYSRNSFTQPFYSQLLGKMKLKNFWLRALKTALESKVYRRTNRGRHEVDNWLAVEFKSRISWRTFDRKTELYRMTSWYKPSGVLRTENKNFVDRSTDTALFCSIKLKV